MSEELDALKRYVVTLSQRVESVEQENAAFSALFMGLAQSLGPSFVDRAATIAEISQARAERGSALGLRMTEALRVIDEIRASSDRHPKPGEIV